MGSSAPRPGWPLVPEVPTLPRHPRSLPSLLLGVLLALLPAAAGALPELALKQPKYRSPELVFSSPPQMAQQAEMLRGLDRQPFAEIAELLGLEDPGPPIRVLVVPEGAEETKIAPPWAVGYALSELGLVVLMPSRVPDYPDGDLAEVLRHEVAHVLVSRAAGGRPVPRFLDEGLAVVAARGWQLRDRSRLLLAVWPLSGKDLPALREDFGGSAEQAGHAYVISAAFVRYLLDQEGGDAGARILQRIADGNSFDAAFRLAIGHPLEDVQQAFWDETDVWQKWIPLIFGSTGFSLLLLLLTVLAWRRRHLKNLELQQAWEEEEAAAKRRRERLLAEEMALLREIAARQMAALPPSGAAPSGRPLPPRAPHDPRSGRTPSGEWIN